MLGHPGVLKRASSLLKAWFKGDPAPAQPRGPFLVIGHRGSPTLEAENTLDSFARALAQGATAIEADVCVTRDGLFVLWHDTDPDDPVALARQLGAEGLLFRPRVPVLGSSRRLPVRHLPWAVLERHYGYVRADANAAAPSGATSATEASIQTLSELLAWCPGQPRLTDVLLDLKLEADQTSEAEALVDLLQRAVETGALPDVVFRLLSPQAEIVNALVAHCALRPPCSQIRVSADFELPGAAELGPGTGARDVSLGGGRRAWPAFRLDVAAAVEARDRGAFDSVIAWTVNEPGRLAELVRLGVDGLITDDNATLRWLADNRSLRAVGDTAPPDFRLPAGRATHREPSET